MSFIDIFGRELHKGDLVAAAVASGSAAGELRVGRLEKEPKENKMLTIRLLNPIVLWDGSLRTFSNVNYRQGSIVKVSEEEVFPL